MQNKFLDTIRKNNLFRPEERILLAVSGGMDSVFMTHLFHKAGFLFGIAHCNFMLRGIESDLDEQFVAHLAKLFQVPFFAKKTNAELFAREKHISVQMAAREIRYRFFNEIIENHEREIKFIATAHHLNDQVETFFINLGRGSGIKGLAGIQIKSGNIIRPILNFTRIEIERYISENNLEYRFDKSNESDYYLRNRIRHSIIPALENIHNGFIESVSKSLMNLEDAKLIYLDYVKKEKSKLLIAENNSYKISIIDLLETKHYRSVFHEILLQFGFNSSVELQLLNSLSDPMSGKKFYSDDYLLIIDRNHLVISRFTRQINETEDEKTFIESPLDLRLHPPFDNMFKLELFSNSNDFCIEKSKFYAYLDLHKLHFPITIRKWRNGDRFNPFGMKGLKKVSDFLIDQKVNLIEKENIRVLVSDDEIIWIIGLRIDGRFTVEKSTTDIMRIEFNPD